MRPDDVIYRNAVISPCKKYRYYLTRAWEIGGGPFIPFIMLNPSAADSFIDDPTIRRCMSFARREGAGGIAVVNLYAFRSTDPKQLLTVEDPVGPSNDFWITITVAGATERKMPIICAWGAHDITQSVRGILDRARNQGAKIVCLGKTKNGHPRHPLYVKNDEPLQEYP